MTSAPRKETKTVRPPLPRPPPWGAPRRQLSGAPIPIRAAGHRIPHSPVQVLIQRLVRILVALDAPHEILCGFVTVTVDIVRAAQFHLLPEPCTEQGRVKAGGRAGPETKENAGRVGGWLGGRPGQGWGGGRWPGGLVPGPSSHIGAKRVLTAPSGWSPSPCGTWGDEARGMRGLATLPTQTISPSPSKLSPANQVYTPGINRG